MKTMKIITLAVATAAALFTSAAEYKLKTSVSVDVFEDGKKIETKRLPAGTIIEISAANETAQPSKAKMPKTSAALTKPTMSSAVFCATRPAAGAVLRVSMELGSDFPVYMPKDVTAENYWMIEMYGRNDDWSIGECLYGYVKKNSPAGKAIFKKVQTGGEYAAFVKVKPLGDDNAMCLILDYAPAKDGR